MNVRYRITVDQVISQWENEYKVKLGEEERATLVLLFASLLEDAVNISIEETMKKWERAASNGVTH